MLRFLNTVPMEGTSELAMNFPITLPLVVSLLLVLWMGQNILMADSAMSYRTTLQTAAVSLQSLNSVVKM